MTNANEPINAFFETNGNGYGQAISFYLPDGGQQIIPYQSGLTKREYFAAMAMQGYAANTIAYKGAFTEEIARYSVEMADALMTELNKNL